MPIAAYTDFSGGLNTIIGPVVLDDGKGSGLHYADDAQNFQMMTNGLLKFPGFTSILNSPLPAAVDGIFGFKYSGVWQIIVCSNGKVYTISSGTATQVYTGNTAGSRYQAIATNSVLLLVNGTDKPLVWNGVTCVQATYTDPTTIWNDFRPAGICEFRNRLFYWGDSSRPDQLLTPAPGTYNNFDNTFNTVDGLLIAPGFGGKIVACKPLRDDYLAIYKEGCIRQLAGSAPFGNPDPWRIYHVSDEIGCVSTACVAQVGLDHYFLSQTGLKHLQQVLSSGNIEAEEPTYIIQDRISGLAFGADAMYKANIGFDQINNRLLINVPDIGSTTNDLTYVFNTVTETNEPRGTDIKASAVAYINGKIYTGDYNGNLYVHGTVNNYNGTAISSFWQSKYVAHGGLSRQKAYRRLNIYTDSAGFSDLSADIIVQWNVLRRGIPIGSQQTESVSSGGSVWDTAQWDQAVWSLGNGSSFEIKNLGRGKAIQLRISNISGTQLPKIREIEMVYDFFGMAKG